MQSSLSIVFNKKQDFQWDELNTWLLENGFSKTGVPGKSVYKNVSIRLVLREFPTNVTVQGNMTSETREVLVRLEHTENLILKGKELKKYQEIFRPENGKVICNECGMPSTSIKSVVDSSQNVSFVAECGHKISTNSPLMISRSRILPDLNRLIARTTSKMIRLGYFNGFEFVIPQYYERYVDNFFAPNGKKRSAFLDELAELRNLETEGKISVYRFPYIGSLARKDRDSEEQIEDEVVIEIGQRTQSIILSADNTVIQKLSSYGLDGILIEGPFDLTVKVNSTQRRMKKTR